MSLIFLALVGVALTLGVLAPFSGAFIVACGLLILHMLAMHLADGRPRHA